MFETQVFSNMTQCSASEIQRLLPLVSPQRREQALRFKHLSGQYACLKSYEMLSQLLAKKFDIPIGTELLFNTNEHGKPTLRDFPQLHFNISHCPHAIAVIVGNHPVGIDVERFVTPKPSLLRYTMSDAEVYRIERARYPERTFARLWTRKEAVFKYLGTGIRDNLRTLLTDASPNIQIHTIQYPARHFALSIAYPKRVVEVVAAVILRNNTLLATQRGYGAWKGWWEFPGGKPEPGEQLEEALHRELREELATHIHIEQQLDTIHYDYDEFHLTMHCFLCSMSDGTYTLQEHQSARWLAADELQHLQWLPADLQLLPRLRELLLTKN